jgi:hypothetical protein
MMAQDDNATQAVRAQLRKACATWAWVGKVLRSENTSPIVAAKFYLAVVQDILLYGSKTWVISPHAMACLEGFHIRAAWRMAKTHKLRQGPRNEWTYLLGIVAGITKLGARVGEQVVKNTKLK